MDVQQIALGAEVRAEAAAQRKTATALQEATGISSSAWQNYFVKCSRDVPYGAIAAVARELGMKPSALLRRAEDRAPNLPEYLLSVVPPEKAAAARKAKAQVAKRARRSPPNG